MKTMPVEVFDKDKNVAKADLVMCDACDGIEFHIFILEGKHNHFQCATCDKSFCDGSCADPIIPEPKEVV